MDEMSLLRECPRCRERVPLEHYVPSSALCRVCRGVARMRPSRTAGSWPMPRQGQPWTVEEDEYLSDRITEDTYAEIGRALGRSAGAIERRAVKRGCTPMTAGLLTTTEVADLLGCSVQYVARLARQGRIAGAQRVPGGRTWLYPLEAIGERPVEAGTVRERLRLIRRQVAKDRVLRHWEPEVDWAA